jgi:3-methylcrotonyl-CoA carboxylase alpha subunit
MQTATRLNIATIAVYSSADANALHVNSADSAYLIGDAPAQDSYLNMDSILQAAIDSGADAIHPGYGFLAENPEFALRCEQTGIRFIGPPVEAIRSMGLKGIAKKLMQDAGVPVLPGLNLVDEKTIAAQLEDIGYPVLIKPEAGGGGKGMKIVHESGHLIDAIQSAKREASSAFGNSTLIVEKYLSHPRHIEIQVFADQHGNCVHLQERDCSLQRRHQKILEEAPAPNFPDGLRQQMGRAAVAAATAIGYVGAGTVEFLLSEDREFYFMEMNTRLQVEHPVTEMITGQDLVEWQIKIAEGSLLPASQDAIGIQGHALEARVYAEDPSNDFLPDSGNIDYLELPPGIRSDNGVKKGDSIGVFYDPMLMKIVAWSDSREKTISQLKEALASLRIAGIKTNRDFLIHVLSDNEFVEGRIATDYLDRSAAFESPSQHDLHDALTATAAYLLRQDKTSSPWQSETNFRLNQENSSDLMMSIAGNDYSVTTTFSNHVISIETPFAMTSLSSDHELHIFRLRDQLTVFLPNRTVMVALPGVESQHSSESEKNVRAPMSGKLISVLVESGAEVLAGTPLVVLEAMKMEHTICAPADGRVDTIHFSVDDLVEEGIELLDFAPSS